MKVDEDWALVVLGGKGSLAYMARKMERQRSLKSLRSREEARLPQLRLL